MRIGSRIVTLITLAAIASVAFALPSVAAAEETSLCSGDGSGCGVTHVHETTLAGSKAELLTSIANVNCDVLFLGDTVEPSGAPLIIKGNFTYSNCSSSSSSCTVTEENGPSVIEVLKEGHETARVTGEGNVHVKCPSLNCFYNGEELLGTGKGPLLSSETNGEVKISEQVVTKVKGIFCPSTSKLDIVITPLSATYIDGGLTATSTSISTSLKGGGKEGAEITVVEGSKVKDTATLSGTNASSATGTVDYAVYKDKECKELATEAGKGNVEGTKAASSEEKELEVGVYYWQAKYLGDSLHEESTSTCSKEVLTVITKSTEKFEPHKTALCTTDDAGKTCLEEHKPSTVDFKDSAAEFLTNLISSKCEGLISGSVGASGEPQKVTGEYKFSSCTNGCVVTEISGGSQLGFLFETSEKSTEELATATTEGLELFYKCGETVKCAYGPIKAVGDSLGGLKTGDNGHITFSKVSLGKGEGLFCPGEASLDALFVASSAFYIREDYGLTSLCSKDEGSPVCKSENQLKTIDYKDKAVELLTSLINVKCEGLVSGTVGTPAAGKPLEIKAELTYTSCSGGCFVTAVSGPGKIMLERSKAEEASATSEGFEIFVKCGTTIKCLLGPEKMAGKALGALTTGDNGHLTFSKVSLGKGEGATCPKEATLDALYVASSAAYIG
jgi:hypothetical protein